MFGTLTVLVVGVVLVGCVIAVLTYVAPSTEYSMYAGAAYPLPVAVIVQDTGADGAVSAHVPFP